jgi:putative transposase
LRCRRVAAWRRVQNSGYAAPPVLNQTWALDFMTETLYDGRPVRLRTVIDEGYREGLENAMGVSLPSRRVVRVLN